MPRFTLRDLFWLTLVVAMGLGWAADHRNAAEAKYKAAREAASEWKREALRFEDTLDRSHLTINEDGLVVPAPPTWPY